MAKLSKITLRNKDLFKKKIVEIYDPIHLQRYWYVKCTSSEEFNKILIDIVPGFDKLVETEAPEDGANDGECVAIVLEGHQIVIFWANLTCINSVSHEALHAVLSCAKSRDIGFQDKDDSLCYMLGFLMEQLFEKLKLTIKKG